uniref:Uncharacterized protein n=1 Tax=Panagrolaimus davidi TaxID=227884 RepID=A0A914QCX6_9BILA
MAKLLLVFSLLVAFFLIFETTQAVSCDIDRIACVASCKFQNCGTGYCENRGGRNTCVCSRCGGDGGSWPNIPSVNVGRG